jgi:hypothetical protein
MKNEAVAHVEYVQGAIEKVAIQRDSGAWQVGTQITRCSIASSMTW